MIIKINNHRDFLRFYWIFLFGMVLFATALILAILKMSWLALILYLVLHYFFRKAFVLELVLRKNIFKVRKTFLGFPYWQRKLQLSEAIWVDRSSRWILKAHDGTRLELMEDALTKVGGLRVFDGNKVSIIADPAAAKVFLNKLEQMLRQIDIKVYHIKN